MRDLGRAAGQPSGRRPRAAPPAVAASVVPPTEITTTPAASPASVDFETTDHESIRGELVGLSEEGIAVRVGDKTVQAPLKKLLSVSLGAGGSAAPPATKPRMMVELTDHSLLAAADVSIARGSAQVTLAGGGAITAPTRSLRWIRFINADPAEGADKQWEEALAAKTASDTLVVRKKGALDYLEGVLGDLGPDELKFMVDKESLAVKRAKIEGLVYYHAAGAPLEEPICEVTLGDGTRLSARKISLADGQIRLTSPAGVGWDGPLSEVRELDFSAGKVRFLSDLAPVASEYTPYFAPKEPIESWNAFFRMRRDRGPRPGQLRVGGKSYRKGLSLHSRGVVAYRLPGAFQRFETLVGIDDSAGESGAAAIEIRGDGKSLWQGDVRGGGEPRPVSVEIAGVKRLEIIVDFGEDLDIGDFVDFCEAKVTK